MNLYKLYIRDGRRFAPAIDFTGWYLNEDYTLSKTKPDKPIAICVLHTISKMVFCELNDNPPLLNWYDAKEYCFKKFLGNGKLPEIHELLMARNLFPDLFPKSGFVWSNTECSCSLARYLTLGSGIVYNDIKDSDNQVFAFLTVEPQALRL